MRPQLAAGVLAAAVLAAGCLSVPPYDPKPLVTYTEAGAGGTVTGPGFALRFAGDDGFHFPDALMIGDVDVLGHDDMASCSGQNEAGLQLAPIRRVNAQSGATVEKNQLTPVLRGPAVVQVTLAWGTQFTCDDITRAPNGTSTFTVFPDGEIVRHDILGDPDRSAIYPRNCMCPDNPSDTPLHVSTYWTLAKASFQDIDTPANLDPQPLPASGTSINNNFDTACLNGGPYQVTFAWWHHLDDVSGHATNTEILGGTALIGADRFMPINSDQTFTDLVLDESSALLIGHDGCRLERARAARYIEPAALAINESTLTPAPSNGIYGGDDGDDEKPGFKLVGTDRAKLVGPVNSPFAVWLRFSHAVDTIRATKANSTGAWYVPQRTDDRSWIVWFTDPLKEGEQIVVEPY